MLRGIATYGDAWISAHYDLITEVKRTEPSEIIQKIYDIKPKNYLVLQGSDRILQFVMEKIENVTWRRHPYKVRSEVSVEEAEVGSIYPIVLSLERCIHVDPILESLGIARTESPNTVYFGLGELETRLTNIKREMITQLSKAKLSPEEEKVYFSITGNNPIFN